ncbi:MAG: 7-carboxy-7-deazaguanine synthase [Ferrimicrobium sp.]
MSYIVKEIYYTLQGEGNQVGRPAVFCRFSRCNLWTGKESQRAQAICQFCDTDFVGTDGPGGGRFAAAADLAAVVNATWGGDSHERSEPYVVCTGGEPLLQLDEPAIDAFHEQGFAVGAETNGTQRAPRGLDWICVSPKAGASLVLDHGDELKLVYPQPLAPPELFENLQFTHFLLQPMDGPQRDENTTRAIDYCLAHPQWRLSLQTHKYTGIR